MVGNVAQIETLLNRGKIAAAAASFLNTPEGENVLKDADLNPRGECAVVPACEYESAAVTFHRMQLTGAPTVILTSIVGDEGILIPMRRTNSSVSEKNPFDIPGKMTTGEWLQAMMDDNYSRSYTVNGTEFAASINEIAEFETVLV